MPERHAPGSRSLGLDHLQAGLLYLLNEYVDLPCCAVAMAIARHLERLLEDPLIELFPELQRQCARGLNHWRARAWFALSDAGDNLH
jgi:hypothetical protein